MQSDILDIDINMALEVQKASLFISRGVGRHIDRVIDFWELIFVKSGELKIREGDHDFTVKPNQSLILWPGRRHYGTATYGRDLAFYWVHFVFEPIEDMQNFISINQYSTPQRPDTIKELLHKLMVDMKDNRADSFSLNLLIKMIFWEVSRQSETRNAPDDPAFALARKTRTFILRHCDEKISASSVADSLRYNPDYLGRVYKKVYGMSVTEAILTEKIREARDLLANSNLTVDEISNRCGFSDDCYFRRVFKQRTGFSPLKYRKHRDQRQIDWRCS